MVKRRHSDAKGRENARSETCQENGWVGGLKEAKAKTIVVTLVQLLLRTKVVRVLCASVGNVK